MRKFGLSLLVNVIVAGMFAASVSALQTVTLNEGVTKFVDISQKDLNIIKIPAASGLKAFTTSKSIDVKVEGESIYINLLDKSATAPQELIIVAGTGTYPMLLIPKGIPTEMIIARTVTDTLRDADQWERSQDHVTNLKELVKAMYQETPPTGYSVTKEKRDATTWLGTQRTVVARYTGASLEGEVHELKNVSDRPIRIAEHEFYDHGILAVSIERYELQPRDITTIYLVTQSSTQRDMNRLTKKYNPLDVLSGKPQSAVTTPTEKKHE